MHHHSLKPTRITSYNVCYTKLLRHHVESNLPENQKTKTRVTTDRDEIFKNKKILLVDDDVRNIFALSSVLGEKDMQIIIAENGREALERLDHEKDFDLVLMDIMMPEMDGYEA